MPNELGELKRLLDHQKQEIELMRAQSNATKSTSTATENEAKDLLRKVRATQQQLAEFSDKANLAKSYLQTSLSDEVFDMVREDKTPAEMWQTLIDNYEKKEWSNTIYYDMLKQITKTRAIIRDLNDMGKNISESEAVKKPTGRSTTALLAMSPGCGTTS
ncbi:unnamed protein product [Aphanomyces euteiches]